MHSPRIPAELGSPVTSIELEYPHPSIPAAPVAGLRPEGARRAINVVVASVAILITLPVFVIVAILVAVTSRGPILYTQTRIGVDRRGPAGRYGGRRRRFDCGGRPFRIYKFRTMYVSNEQKSARWAQPGDPRVTPVGRWLRRLRLDELPQLFNVLLGDMNIVGPRPEQPKIFSELREVIPEYADRQLVRPGITGWAQINLSYDQTLEDVRRKVRYDLEYITRQSVGEDVRIMLRTIPVMITKRGAW